MKTLLIAVSLAAALIAMPVAAQQGPAGVPGAPGLAPMSSTPLPPAPPPAPPKQAARPADCRSAKNVEQCKARQEVQRRVREACQGKSGKPRQQCVKTETRAAECSISAEPARCERYRKARELCSEKLGNEHQQCLRDNLTAKK